MKFNFNKRVHHFVSRMQQNFTHGTGPFYMPNRAYTWTQGKIEFDFNSYTK
jgi:hypothetical protein